MKNITKKILALFLALSTMITLIVPAFAAVNVDGQGGSSANVSGGGANTYNASDQMWKISVYYSRYDTNTEYTKTLGTASHWKQYGETFYMYNPTAVRGASGKIKLHFFENALFVAGNKAQFLSKSSTIPSNFTLSFYSENYFYQNTSSPAIAMDGFTIDAVKEFFKEEGNFVALAKEAYKAAGYDNWTSPFGNTTFCIDGMNGNYVDKTANGGKAQNGYVWSTGKHLTFNDWYKGIKTDYNGKQIYLHPKTSDGKFMSATAWMIVFEPVLCVEVGGFNIGGSTYKYVACTPTEFAILQQNGVANFYGLGNTIFNYFSNSTYLDESWVGISKRGSAFTKNTALNTIYQQAGIGMKIFDPYNYVIKDYKVDISAPASVAVGVPFNLTFTHSNISQEWIGNTGEHEAPINVKYVWLAGIKKGSTAYWFDLWDLRKNTLSTSTALKDSSGKFVTTYADAAKIIESRRANESNGLSPFNKNKHYYRGAKDSNGNARDKSVHTYSYTVSSEFNNCSLDIRAVTNADSNGLYTNAKKELSSGAYYKSGEDANWGNNYIKNSTDSGYIVPVGSITEIDPVISVQLNNKTSNEDINLAGKRFAVWCIGGTKFSTTQGTVGDYAVMAMANPTNAGWVGIIETDANGYGQINLADVNAGSGQDAYGRQNTSTNRTATGVGAGFFGSNYSLTGLYWIPHQFNTTGSSANMKDSYWKGNVFFYEHPNHGRVDTSLYTESNEVVTLKSTGAVVTGFTPSYEIQAVKASGYTESALPLREFGYKNKYMPLDGTLRGIYGVMFGGGTSTGTNGEIFYYNENNKMTFVIRPIDNSYNSATKYNYGGKELKVYGYVDENGVAVTTQANSITFGKIKAVYDSSLTGTKILKPQTTNYFLNTEIANCPIKNGMLTLDGSKVVYEDLIVFNLTTGNTRKDVTIDIVEEPGTVVVNYAKGSGCTISSFEGAQVRLEASDGSISIGVLNASGTVTFKNVPAGPYTVFPVVNGDTNMDGHLCSCDGSITQLSTAIDVGCNGSKIQI